MLFGKTNLPAEENDEEEEEDATDDCEDDDPVWNPSCPTDLRPVRDRLRLYL